MQHAQTPQVLRRSARFMEVTQAVSEEVRTELWSAINEATDEPSLVAALEEQEEKLSQLGYNPAGDFGQNANATDINGQIHTPPPRGSIRSPRSVAEGDAYLTKLVADKKSRVDNAIFTVTEGKRKK